MELKVLIVDDARHVGVEMLEMIEAIGGQGTFYYCPTTCLEALRQSPQAFGWMLVDFAMPRINGLEFLEAASKLVTNDPRKIIMSGLAEINGKAIEMGPGVEFLSKPIRLSTLKEKMGHPHD